MSNCDRQDTMSEEAFEAQRAELYRRLSLLTLALAEEAGEAAAGFAAVDRGRFERRIAAMTHAIWAHQVIERLRTGKAPASKVTELAAESRAKAQASDPVYGAAHGAAGIAASSFAAGPRAVRAPAFRPDDAPGRAREFGPAAPSADAAASAPEPHAPQTHAPEPHPPENPARSAGDGRSAPAGEVPPPPGGAAVAAGEMDPADFRALYERAWRGEPDAIAALAEIVRAEREAISAARAPP